MKKTNRYGFADLDLVPMSSMESALKANIDDDAAKSTVVWQLNEAEGVVVIKDIILTASYAISFYQTEMRFP